MANDRQSQSFAKPAGPKRPAADVYTMPEKFHTQDGLRVRKKSPVLKIAIITVIVLAVVGGGVFALQRFLGPGSENANTNVFVQTNILTNLNQNRNSNTANTNQSLNFNLNSTSNTNKNLNIFSNTNTNTNSNLNANTTLPSSRDTDLDNVTDEEERAFGTDFQKPDTDGDGFSDGQEIVNNYNPLGAGKLDQQTFVKTYAGLSGFTVLYPAAFTESPDPQDPDAALFASTTGEFFSVGMQENPAALSAKDWYLTKSPGVDSSKVQSVQNWSKTLEGAKSLDGHAVYYVKGTTTYVLSYNTNVLTEANYPTAFQMFYFSFNVSGGGTTNTNSSVNQNKNTNTKTNTNASANTNTNGNSYYYY